MSPTIKSFIVSNPEMDTSQSAPEKKATTSAVIDDHHRSALEKIGGFDLLSRRPLVGTQKNLLVISGRNVRNYSYETGAFINEYSFGNDRKIVAIQANPQNADELTVVSDNGRILLWNTVENIKIDEFFLTIGSSSKVTTFYQVGDTYYFTLFRRLRSGKKVSQIFCKHKNSDNVMSLNSADQVNINQTDKSVAFGPDRQNPKFCATLYRDTLFIYQIPLKINSIRAVHSMRNNRKKFTCVAYHPTDEAVVVTGNNIGQICIWSNILQTTPDELVACRTLHWHSQPVNDLAFSPSGTFLYSVGAEKTLVKWNLVGKFAGEKSFLPRLGAAILSVVASTEADNLVIVSLADQTIATIDATSLSNGIQREIEGLTIGFNEEGRFNAPLAYNARLNSLVMNGRVGHVQIYCPSTQKQLRQVDITEQNVISAINVQSLKERLKNKGKLQLTKIYPLEVTAIAISEDGKWMATVEYRDDGETLPEVRLKFWELNRKNHFRLNTTIHLPHTQQVTSIAFSPTVQTTEESENRDFAEFNPLHLVSTSADRSFKIWDLNKTESGRPWWNCSRTGTLNSYAVPRMASFSADGSLLSVLFDQSIVTLWELEAPDIVRYIPRLDLFEQGMEKTKEEKQKLFAEPVLFLEFASDAYSHYLVSGTATTVTVRNVLKKLSTVFTFEYSALETFPSKSSKKKAAKSAKAAEKLEIKHHWDSMTYSRADNVLAMISQAGVTFLSIASGTVLFRLNFERVNYGGTFKGAIVAAVFTPEVPSPNGNLPLKRSTFYAINEKHELFQLVAFDGSRAFTAAENGPLVAAAGERERRSLYMQAVLKSGVKKVTEEEGGESSRSAAGSEVNRAKNRKTIVDKFFYNVPSHVLPPVALYEKAYLASCMGLLNLTAQKDL